MKFASKNVLFFIFLLLFYITYNILKLKKHDIRGPEHVHPSRSRLHSVRVREHEHTGH